MDYEGKREFESSMGRFLENLFLLHLAHNIGFDQVKVCVLFLCPPPDSKLSFTLLIWHMSKVFFLK